jgi:hypothetical protein
VLELACVIPRAYARKNASVLKIAYAVLNAYAIRSRDMFGWEKIVCAILSAYALIIACALKIAYVILVAYANSH